MSESQKFHTKSPGLTLRVFVTWGFAAAQSVPGSAVAGSAGGSRLKVVADVSDEDIAEVRFVYAVTAGYSVKFLPLV